MYNIDCSEILRKTYFDSYSEFYLALAIARECGRRGTSLDMSKMLIDASVLPKEGLEYFKYLVSIGSIVAGEVESTKPLPPPINLYVDTECFEELKRVLFKVEDKCYYWSYEYAKEFYKCSNQFQLLGISKTGNTLLHLIAYLLVSFHLNELEVKKIEIDLNRQLSLSTYSYINILSCCKTMDWLEDLIILHTDTEGYHVDVDYSILCNNGVVAGRNKIWGIKEKLGFLKDEGIVEGSIAILWRRKGMCKNNLAGKITGATVIKVNEIGDTFIAVSSIAVNKTKEEIESDYNEIPEEKRYLFSDMLESKPDTSDQILSLYSIGVNNYFFDETEFITRIDRKGKVTKKITVDGVVGDVEMREIDAIYWLLCQYDIDFDRELYKNMYNQSEPLLWDKYSHIEEFE